MPFSLFSGVYRNQCQFIKNVSVRCLALFVTLISSVTLCSLCCVHVLVPTLKTLCMLSVLDAGLDPSCLPQDVR